MLKAGTLNRRVSLQRHEQGQDELGQPIDTWVEFANVAANVRMLTGKEVLTADTDVGIGTASIRIRYRTDVTNGDRAVVDGTTIFNISAALPNIAGRDYTDLVCTFGANTG